MYLLSRSTIPQPRVRTQNLKQLYLHPYSPLINASFFEPDGFDELLAFFNKSVQSLQNSNVVWFYLATFKPLGHLVKQLESI